jgi:hypothetical protein
MADHNVTLQTRSCKDSQARKQSKPFPYTRQLTVLETATTPRTRAQSIGVHYIPVQLEPCIVLSGKWLREAGFHSQQKVAVQVEEGALNIKLVAENDGLASIG